MNKVKVCFIVFITVLTASLYFFPGHNGDLPFYIAAALQEKDESDSAALEKSKQIIRSELNEAEFPAHIYRIEHAEKGILNYYRAKPLYVASVRGARCLGWNYTRSTQLPSLISFFLIGVLVFSWCSRRFDPLPALAFSILLLLMNPSIVLGRLSSPDALSHLLLFAAFYRIWFDKKYLVTVLLLTLSLFVRPDNLLTVLVFLSLMKVWPGPKISTTAYALSVLLAVASCFAVNYFFEPRFWWFRRTNSQQTFLYLQSLQGYRDQVMIYLSNLTQSLVLPVVLTGAAVYFRNGKRFSRRALYFLRAVLMVVLIRFIIFPYTEERFMSSFYLCSLLILLEELFRGPVERNTA